MSELNADSTLNMTQKGLIYMILNTAKMEHCNTVQTPMPQVGLGSDPEGDSFSNKKWNYPSLVGMLLYLANNTSTDITFAISKITKFTNSHTLMNC